MVAAGGILFFNGLQMYEYYQIRDVADDLPGNLALYDNVRVMQRIRVVCADVTQAYSGPPELISLDIHGSDSFIPIEFAGAAASVVFYVRDISGSNDAGKGYVSDTYVCSSLLYSGHFCSQFLSSQARGKTMMSMISTNVLHHTQCTPGTIQMNALSVC